MIKIFFPLIFSIITWIMSFFVFKNLRHGEIISTLIVLFLWVSMYLNHKKPSSVSRLIYQVSLLSFAVISQLFFFFLIADILKIQRIYFLVFVLVIDLYGIINSQKISIRRYDLGIGKKVVHLSDLHIGPANREKNLKKVIEITNSLNPDLVLITGDLVDMSTELDLHLFDYLKNIKARKFMVHGNHELYDGKKKVEKRLKMGDITILNNESIYTKGLTIIGVDYKSSPELILKKSKIKGKSILLIHEPVWHKYATKYNIDLVLSGHTHGGQFFPFTLFVKLFYKFTRGHHKYRRTDIIVSMGTLTWGPQLRIGSRNEVIVIE
jgi:uncharacterized protein